MHREIIFFQAAHRGILHRLFCRKSLMYKEIPPQSEISTEPIVDLGISRDSNKFLHLVTIDAMLPQPPSQDNTVSVVIVTLRRNFFMLMTKLAKICKFGASSLITLRT